MGKPIRVPRKIKKKIPKGVCCYTPIGIIWGLEAMEFKVRTCSFYHHYEGTEGYCRLTRFGIEDQDKSCGINDTIKNDQIQ
jgi:hypothetical protein